MSTARAMLMNFCIVNTPRCQILIWACKVFCLFQQTFSCEKVKVILWKDRELQLLSIFRCQDIPKTGLHSQIMFPHQFTTSVKVTWKTITFIKFWLVMYKYWFIFNKAMIIITSHIQIYFTCYSEFTPWWRTYTVHNSVFFFFFLSYLLNAKLYT